MVDIVRNGRDRALVVLADREIEQVAGFAERVGQRADAADDAIEIRALLAELLRALRVVPDVRVFELARDFFEAFGLRIEVKDTPEATPRGRVDRRCGRGSGWCRSGGRWPLKRLPRAEPVILA